jgi:MGT family glycosyltransferase
MMTNIWVLPTPGIPPIGPGFMPARGPLGRARDALLRRLVTRVFNRALPSLNAVRRDYGLGPVASTHAQMLRCDRMLVTTSPVFDLTSPAMPTNVRWVGPLLDDPAWSGAWQSPWPADDGRPLVLVGLSSTFQDQVAALRRIVEALGSLPVRGLVTRGPTIRADEVAGKDNVVVVASAPHGEVLRGASALVTHCGHGTTMKGLVAGVPLVCMPMGRDQNDTAARVVHRGAGVRLDPKASVDRIRAAIGEVLDDPRYREAARRLGDAIRRGEGCVDPVAELEGLAASRAGRRAVAHA